MDESAFSDYVAAWRPRLFRTACLLCGDPHRAEDGVQDVLARLYAAWDRVERMDNIDGYVRSMIISTRTTATGAGRGGVNGPRSPATYRSSRGFRSRMPT